MYLEARREEEQVEERTLTIRISNELHTAIKTTAAKENRSIKEICIEILTEYTKKGEK